MKKLGLVVLVILVATVWLAVASVYAQASLSSWPFLVTMTSNASAPGLYDLVVPFAVMDKAREDLTDLRLYDANGREIPYALRVRREVDDKQVVAARIFNESYVGSTTSEVSVDLGENPGEHNEVEIQTTGSNFRRQAEVEGSDSGREWRTLNSAGVIFSFEAQNQAADSERVTYPTSRYRYLRVRVKRDELTDDESPDITGVKVLMAVHETGEVVTWGVPVPSYQLLRNQGAHASQWDIDLGARVPCDGLTLEFADPSFSRAFQIETVDDPQNIRVIANGELTRHLGGEAKPLVINFNEEVYARKLRLQFTDYSNETLSLTSIQASAPSRDLVFQLKEPPAEPLRLYFGNSKVTAPHYDFEKELPARLATKPIPGTVGSVVPNPEYKPEPLPFTERVPWLIYLVLAASSVTLALILISLARTTMQPEPQQTE